MFEKGGGLLGALGLAREELTHRSAEAVLTREQVASLRGTDTRPASAEGRYVPFFESSAVASEIEAERLTVSRRRERPR